MTAIESQPPAAPAERVPWRPPSGSTPVRPEIRRRRKLPDSWPLWVGVAGFPLFWALGVTPILFPLLAIPVGWKLLHGGRVRFPPGFGLWAMFLLWVLASSVTLNLHAPGTLPPSGNGRYFAFALRFADYVAMTVLMLYVGNRSLQKLSQRTVMTIMSTLCLTIVSLGLLSVFMPYAGFHSPLSGILPSALLPTDAGGEPGILRLAQTQDLLGYTSPRPAAPFTYTNAWGNALSLTLVWLVVRFGFGGSNRHRFGTIVFLSVAMVPIIYSLNRGLWLGLAFSVAYVVIRMALRGRIALVGVSVFAIGLLAAAVVFSPLGATIQGRLSNGHSNDIRSQLANGALTAMKASPVLGYGSTRQTQGSGQSISVGKTADCPKCGNRNIGSTGQLWLLLIAQGLIGTLLYFGFFARMLWVYRHDGSPVGIAGSLVILLSFLYALFYTALLIPLCITMLSVALMWRNGVTRELHAKAVAGSTSAQAPPSGTVVQ
jgi:hypothetical protein